MMADFILYRLLFCFQGCITYLLTLFKLSNAYIWERSNLDIFAPIDTFKRHNKYLLYFHVLKCRSLELLNSA